MPATQHPERTFLAARHEFENIFMNLARAKRNWQLVAFVLLALLGTVIVSYVQLASTSRIMPYVVEVDQLGRAVAFGPAEPLRVTDRRVTVAELVTFLKNVRTVVPSADAQRDLIRRAYAFVDQRGAAFLNEYFANPANDPRILGTRMTRLVELTSILPVPGALDATTSTWKVQWTERELPTAAGTTARTTAWEGYLTTRTIPPQHADVIEENPLGLYITTITWTQIATTSGDLNQ
jgi:type IV secretory pathway TrbF-like protein